MLLYSAASLRESLEEMGGCLGRWDANQKKRHVFMAIFVPETVIGNY